MEAEYLRSGELVRYCQDTPSSLKTANFLIFPHMALREQASSQASASKSMNSIHVDSTFGPPKPHLKIPPHWERISTSVVGKEANLHMTVQGYIFNVST